MKSMKIQCILMLLVLFMIPSPGFAEETYDMFPVSGRIEFVSYSGDNIYIQSTLNYPESILYQYNPETMFQPELVLDSLTAERDYLFAVGDKKYVFKSEEDSLKQVGGNDNISLSSSGWNPFLMSFFEDNSLVFLLEKDEDIHIWRLDTLTRELKKISIGNNLFSVQPYISGRTLVFNNNGNTKDIIELDWDSFEQTKKGNLPAEATSIAYDKYEDVIYYLKDGCLWQYDWDGTNKQLASGFPYWTDQRAFVLAPGIIATPFIDANESLLVIKLKK